MKINKHRDMILKSGAIAAVSLVMWSLDLWNWLLWQGCRSIWSYGLEKT